MPTRTSEGDGKGVRPSVPRGLRLLLVLAITCCGLLAVGRADASPAPSGAPLGAAIQAAGFALGGVVVADDGKSPLKGCPAAGRTAPPAEGAPRWYRYIAAAEFEAICQTGLLRGGRPGETFWGDVAFDSADEAQDRYSLPTRPQLRLQFRILNSPTLSRDGSLVAPAFGGRGGEREWASFDPVEVEVLDVVPLE